MVRDYRVDSEVRGKWLGVWREHILQRLIQHICNAGSAMMTKSWTSNKLMEYEIYRGHCQYFIFGENLLFLEKSPMVVLLHTFNIWCNCHASNSFRKLNQHLRVNAQNIAYASIAPRFTERMLANVNYKKIAKNIRKWLSCILLIDSYSHQLHFILSSGLLSCLYICHISRIGHLRTLNYNPSSCEANTHFWGIKMHINRIVTDW